MSRCKRTESGSWSASILGGGQMVEARLISIYMAGYLHNRHSTFDSRTSDNNNSGNCHRQIRRPHHQTLLACYTITSEGRSPRTRLNSLQLCALGAFGLYVCGTSRYVIIKRIITVYCLLFADCL
jgi:hypothetical protein